MNWKNGKWAVKPCLQCKKETDNQIYCSHRCAVEHKLELIFEKIDRGEYIAQPYGGNGTLKKYLISRRGRQCERCKNTEWLGEELPLTPHHVDGDANNNRPINLQLLCYNCHGKTPNYGRKNKKSARVYKYRIRDVNGSMLASQAECTGSNPAECSNFNASVM